MTNTEPRLCIAFPGFVCDREREELRQVYTQYFTAAQESGKFSASELEEARRQFEGRLVLKYHFLERHRELFGPVLDSVLRYQPPCRQCGEQLRFIGPGDENKAHRYRTFLGWR